jgi:hypothetical protein
LTRTPVKAGTLTTRSALSVFERQGIGGLKGVRAGNKWSDPEGFHGRRRALAITGTHDLDRTPQQIPVADSVLNVRTRFRRSNSLSGIALLLVNRIRPHLTARRQ